MKFKELAWGAFTYKNVNKGTQGTTIYNELVSDIEFLKRLQTSPGLGDCERIRDFLVHFGVRFTPISRSWRPGTHVKDRVASPPLIQGFRFLPWALVFPSLWYYYGVKRGICKH